MKEIFSSGSCIRIRAGGTSMSPFIRNGDCLLIEPAQEKILETGDVVAAMNPSRDRILIHRVIAKNGKGCLLQGDAAPFSDGYISRKHIMGKVVRIERNGKGVRFGLGPGRILLAILARAGLLRLVSGVLRRLSLKYGLWYEQLL